MISANDARELYEEPELTLEEIEAEIRKDAKAWTMSLFKKSRLSVETRKTLESLGYTLEDIGVQTSVNWKAPEPLAEIQQDLTEAIA